uniref:JmjC domain-containing protein n=1 Tax=Panagrolaimus sp. ES5 TaxID=591445 RepID=A0AC34FLB7_9BILA
MEVRLSYDDMKNKCLVDTINDHLGNEGILKIVPSLEYAHVMDAQWKEFFDDINLLVEGTSRHYQMTKVANHLYAVQETEKENNSQLAYSSDITNYRSPRLLEPSRSNSQGFDLIDFFSKDFLDARCTADAFNRRWYKTVAMASYLKNLRERGTNIPAGWDMVDLENPLKYPSHLIYESSMSMTPLSIEQAELPRISLLLPTSSPKVFLTFKREDQIQLNEIIRRNKEHVCISPLLHNSFVIDLQQLKESSINPVITYQDPNEFIVIDSGICFASVNLGCSISEVKNFYRNHSIPSNIQRYKCQCYVRRAMENPQIVDTVETFSLGLEYKMMSATAGNLIIPKRAKIWTIDMVNKKKEQVLDKSQGRLDADEIFPDNNDDASSLSSSSTKQSTTALGLNIYTRDYKNDNRGCRIPSVKDNTSDPRIVNPLNNLLNNMEDICKPQDLNSSTSLPLSQHPQNRSSNSNRRLNLLTSPVKATSLSFKNESQDETLKFKFPPPLATIDIPEMRKESQRNDENFLITPNNLPPRLSPQEIQPQYASPVSSVPVSTHVSTEPKIPILSQFPRKRLFGSSAASNRDDRRYTDDEDDVRDDAEEEPIKRLKLVQPSAQSTQQSEILKTLKHNNASKSWYDNLPDHRKAARHANDIGRKRDCKDPIAIFFKSNFQNIRDRLKTIDLCIGYYLDNGIQKPRTKRSLHQLYEDRQMEDALADELVQQREIINILKKIYCKAKSSLRECINVGFSGADIVRCFFTRKNETNREIYKLAVKNTTMSDDRKDFYLELIEVESEWNDFFGVQYGYRIPWMEWIDSFDASVEALEVYDHLDKEEIFGDEEEKIDNDDNVWDPYYSIETLDDPNVPNEIVRNDSQFKDQLKDVKKKKSKKQKKSGKKKSSQLKFSQIIIDETTSSESDKKVKKIKKKKKKLQKSQIDKCRDSDTNVLTQNAKANTHEESDIEPLKIDEHDVIIIDDEDGGLITKTPEEPVSRNLDFDGINLYF